MQSPRSAPDAENRSDRTLAVLLALALAARLGSYALFPGIVHADEVFQYAEPATRLVFGEGLIPWEWRLQIRSWLFPGFLAGVMELSRLAGTAPGLRSGAVALALALTALPMVAASVRFGRAGGGPAGGLLAGLAVALWPDVLLAGTHPLIDGVATSLLLPGLWLVFRAADGVPSRAAPAGLALGLLLATRPQLAPAAAVALGLAGRAGDRRTVAAAAAVAAAVLLGAGLLDWATLGAPFRSLIGYIAINRAGAANYYGTAPWYEYIVVLLWSFGVAVLPLAVLAALAAGTRPGRRLLAVGAAVLAGFSLVAHKETRFILPAYPLFLTAAGIGLARLAGRRRALTVAALAASLATTAIVPLGSAKLFRRGTGVTALMHQAAADPAACGVAIDPPAFWYLTGGLSHLRPGMTLSGWDPANPGAAYVLAPAGRDPGGRSRLLRCVANMEAGEAMPRVCLWAVPDGCAKGAAPNVTLPLPEFLKGVLF